MSSPIWIARVDTPRWQAALTKLHFALPTSRTSQDEGCGDKLLLALVVKRAASARFCDARRLTLPRATTRPELLLPGSPLAGFGRAN